MTLDIIIVTKEPQCNAIDSHRTNQPRQTRYPHICIINKNQSFIYYLYHNKLNLKKLILFYLLTFSYKNAQLKWRKRNLDLIMDKKSSFNVIEFKIWSKSKFNYILEFIKHFLFHDKDSWIIHQVISNECFSIWNDRCMKRA